MDSEKNQRNVVRGRGSDRRGARRTNSSPSRERNQRAGGGSHADRLKNEKENHERGNTRER